MELRALFFQRAYFRHVSPGVLPKTAKLTPVQVAETGRESVRLVTYSPYDPIELPKVLFDLLGAFDGRSLEEARRNILEDFGFELEPDLIQRLFDFGILSQNPRSARARGYQAVDTGQFGRRVLSMTPQKPLRPDSDFRRISRFVPQL